MKQQLHRMSRREDHQCSSPQQCNSHHTDLESNKDTQGVCEPRQDRISRTSMSRLTSGSSESSQDIIAPDAPHFNGVATEGGGACQTYPLKSSFRGVSYDKKKRKWRVQIKVASLGKSGVSVGYYSTELAAAQAYDRAAISLLGWDNESLVTNFNKKVYRHENIPDMRGQKRDEVKLSLKNERAKVQTPRRRFTRRRRTSRYQGVGASNRKNQWQARILIDGKVTHLGYYETEDLAAKVYDRVNLSLNGWGEQTVTNFPKNDYLGEDLSVYQGLQREDLQRQLGVRPMDKSSKYRGVSKKKGKWEAKVMVNRKWAYRHLFDTEEEAALAYDVAVKRLKPNEAHAYLNFPKDVDCIDHASARFSDAISSDECDVSSKSYHGKPCDRYEEGTENDEWDSSDNEMDANADADAEADAKVEADASGRVQAEQQEQQQVSVVRCSASPPVPDVIPGMETEHAMHSNDVFLGLQGNQSGITAHSSLESAMTWESGAFYTGAGSHPDNTNNNITSQFVDDLVSRMVAQGSSVKTEYVYDNEITQLVQDLENGANSHPTSPLDVNAIGNGMRGWEALLSDTLSSSKGVQEHEYVWTGVDEVPEDFITAEDFLQDTCFRGSDGGLCWGDTSMMPSYPDFDRTSFYLDFECSALDDIMQGQ